MKKFIFNKEREKNKKRNPTKSKNIKFRAMKGIINFNQKLVVRLWDILNLFIDVIKYFTDRSLKWETSTLVVISFQELIHHHKPYRMVS